MEGKSIDLWKSYKELNQFVEACISKPIDGVAAGLSKALTKYKHNFLHVMKNAPKNSRSRRLVESKASGNATLPQEIVDEAITLSNMYNLDEQVALDLLCTAQQKCADYPGIPRGPVAILLYYDAHFALVATLKMLVQTHHGLRWETPCAADVQKCVSKFVDELVADGLFDAIFAALSSLNLAKEIALLQQNQGLGGAYHHHLVTTLFSGIRATLADIVLLHAAQVGLSAQPLLALLNHLRSTAPEMNARGGLDSVCATLLVALLYAVDVSIVEEKDDIENIHSCLPILAEDNLISLFHAELCSTQSVWACAGLRTVAQCAWGLTLASVRSFTSSVRSMDSLPDDEDTLVQQCIQENVFHFVNHSLLTADGVFKQELLLRKLHSLVTEFIVLMPIHVRELRARADEECMKVQTHLNQGLHAPGDLTKHFEEFLHTISLLYSEDPLHLKLHQEYWCLQTYSSQMKTRIPPKQICLLKFIKQCGESLHSQLFIPYLRMLTALTSSPEAARETFTMLKSFSKFVCWDHFFASFACHLAHLKQDQAPVSDTIYQRQRHHKAIAPLEVQGLQAVLGLVRAVASHDELSRQKMVEHSGWNAVQVMLSLLTCSVHIDLKAELVLTLAAFAKSPPIAAALWHQIEAAQIIPTLHTTSNFQSRGVLSELEEVESRNEEYPLTRAVLALLTELTNSPVPFSLGSGTRVPGLDPYMKYILNSVLLTFSDRAYKQAAEKWDVARACVHLLVKFTFDYEPRHEDFTGGGVPGSEGGVAKSNPHPGCHIMLNMCSQSQLLRTILSILDEGCLQFDKFSPFPGKSSLEAATLECLRLVSCVLDLQKTFLSYVYHHETSYLLSGLHQLLFSMNYTQLDRTHAVNIAKYITYSTWLPQHAHYTARILRNLTGYATAQNDLLSSIVVSSATLRHCVLHGFVKCLEAEDEDEDDTSGSTSLASKTKVLILKLMLQCLSYSAPNLTQFLCGFPVTSQSLRGLSRTNVSATVLQHAGVLGTPRTCLHAIIQLLDESLRARATEQPPLYCASPLVVRLSYQLLYCLAAHSDTSAPILRHLRSANDVLHAHVARLPFNSSSTGSSASTEDLYQMSWLLKLVAIELRVTAHQSQISQLTKLVDVLISNGTGVDQAARNSIVGNPPTGPRLYMRLLSLIDLSHRPIEEPQWDCFEEDKMVDIFRDAEFVSEPNLKKINVKRVRQILLNEISMVTEWPSLAEKQRFLTEVEAVVEFAIRYNSAQQSAHALWSYCQAWKQMAGILFEVTPHDLIPVQTRFDMLVQVIDALLEKVQVDTIRLDLAGICAESLLLMMSNLRSTFVRGKISLSQLMCPREMTVLPAIVEWIMNAGPASQQLRAHLYAALLTFLHIARDDGLSLRRMSSLGADDESLDSFAVREELSMLASVETSVSVTSPFNVLIDEFPGRLVDTLCIDVTGGHDICKMLALATLSSLVEVNVKWVSYLSCHGFLKLIIDSVVASDRSLVDVLINQQANLRPLFVFESRMAFLTRVALTRQGAELLLEHNIIKSLSDMSVFDHHPDMSFYNDGDSYEGVPVNSKFQQVIMPSLHFLKSILVTLGSQNRSATSQIMLFLLNHLESVIVVLRYGTPRLPIGLLRELSALTSILASTCTHLEGEVSRESIRLQNMMTALVYRFNINTQTASSIEAAQTDSDLMDVMNCVLDVQCNVLLFLKNLTAASGMDKRQTNVILDPSLTASELGEGGYASLYSGNRANLGVIVKQLVDAVTQYHHETPSLALLGNKIASVRDMNAATLNELVPSSNISVSIDETRRVARSAMLKQFSMKKAELSKLRYIVDTCLYLVWSHLDYFMLRGVPKSLISRTKLSPEKSSSPFSKYNSSALSESAWDASVERLQRMREDLVPVFNETFSSRLVQTAETERDRNYVEALLRRIKKLVQFAPTDVDAAGQTEDSLSAFSRWKNC